MLKIATFNVNSIRMRYESVLSWLRDCSADIVLLQELKCQDEDFRKLDFGSYGYEALSHGQKAYNGVAILSRFAMTEIARGFDDQSRFLAVETGGVKVASLYCPNGNPIHTEKFPYKLQWMEQLESFVRQRVLPDESLWVLGGDYNICPDERAVWNVESMKNDALCQVESISCYRRLLNLGLTDAWRSLHSDEIGYSFWDYQGGAYAKNHGLLIDFLLLSPEAADRLRSAEIDTKPRSGLKPSDHTPVVCSLDFAL